jgi:hypothetical protein
VSGLLRRKPINALEPGDADIVDGRRQGRGEHGLQRLDIEPAHRQAEVITVEP